VQQLLPHPFIELLAMAHGQGSFDRAVRELKQHVGHDVQTEERCERAKRGKDVYAKVGNVMSSLGTSDEYIIIDGICRGRV
jgi:hypothetical protein